MYWLSGVVSMRAVGHVLQKVDSRVSNLHKSIIDNFWACTKKQKPAIFWEFIDNERNMLIKEGKVGAAFQKHTYSKFLVDYNRSYEDLVQQNGEFVGLEWEGDDALRLYEIALVWWHEKLCLMEGAIDLQISKPFEADNTIQNKLLDQSNYVASCPKTSRL
ncbi:MAG: hypothetical protein DHS20C05_24840 [Hyphococcus sp.]|nr:MAG: hypothetical protein DHS20C05_24840 [Marinicaulis sp.]